jgi:hypothetical protein
MRASNVLRAIALFIADVFLVSGLRCELPDGHSFRIARDSIRIVKAPQSGPSRSGDTPWSSDQLRQLPYLFQPAVSALIVT